MARYTKIKFCTGCGVEQRMRAEVQIIVVG